MNTYAGPIADRARQVELARLRSEQERVKAGKALLKSEIREQEAKMAHLSLQQRGSVPLQPMPGSFISSSADTSTDAGDSDHTEVPGEFQRAQQQQTAHAPGALQPKFALLDRIAAALTASDRAGALRAGMELVAVLHDDVHLHHMYLESVVAQQATKLAHAALTMQKAGMALPDDMLHGAGGCYSESAATDVEEEEEEEEDGATVEEGKSDSE